MANSAPAAVMNTVAGYPVFSSQDSAGTKVTPFGAFVWNSNTSLWVPWPVDANGNPQVSLTGNNPQLDATTLPLAANASYTTGTPFSLSSYKSIVGSVLTDQPGTLFIQQSTDGTNFDVVSNINITGIPATWSASTSYSAGNQVRQNNNVYQCTTPGNSGPTAPSGTGSSIQASPPTGTTTWAVNTPYALNANVIPTTPNGFYYTCTTAGTSNATTQPTWPTTEGATVTDGTVTWTAHAEAVFKYVSPVYGQSFNVDVVGVKGQLTLVNGSTAQGLLRLRAGGKNI